MNWKRVHFYLHTFCRYFLATMILSYAFAKILGTQFTSQPSTYDQPISSLSGFNLTWYYYGYSFWYGIFIAISQIASSLLLLFRKTTRIGIVLFLSFMVNILLVDYAYDIQGAKGMATTMTIMALFIFFSEYQLFIKYFLEEPPLFQDFESPNWINKSRKAKWIYIPIIFIGLFFGLSTLKSKFMTKNQFYGTWQNTDTNSKFKNFNFEFANTFKINGVHNIDKIANGQYSFANDTLTLKTYTKEYEAFLNNDKTNAILSPDTTKMVTLIKGKYHFNKNVLTIQIDANKIELKKVR
ncbi:hypothetical protein [Flavobacterium sp.]|uniref:hypothetical protein n=1 Tax=Flavobacterium sp. TaxID=239 RepID=UPI0038FC93A2